jgi:hypothetical protein
MMDMGIDWICWTVYYACKGNIRHITMKTRYPDAMQVALTSLYILFTTSRMMAAMKNKIVFSGITFRTR